MLLLVLTGLRAVNLHCMRLINIVGPLGLSSARWVVGALLPNSLFMWLRATGQGKMRVGAAVITAVSSASK